MAVVSYSLRLRQLAESHADRPAVTCGDESVTYAQLAELIDDLAVDLRDRGVRPGDMVTIALPNSVDWFVAFAAAWRLGATPQPVSARLPQREIDAIVELADPSAVLGVPADSIPGRICLPIGYRAPARPADAVLEELVSKEWKAPTSGGSTGRPKLIVSGDPAAFDPEVPSSILLGATGPMIMPGPLYHNGPLIWSVQGLLYGNGVAVLPRFDAEATLAAIEQHHGEVVYMVPTMMKRIWRLPEDVRLGYDLSSLQVPVAPRRTLPRVAEAGVDRLARTRADRRALRRHRRTDRDGHQRHRMAGPPRFGRSTGAGQRADHRRRRQRTATARDG